ncbi:MAG TPA: cytochrome P450 [Candidatus Limnocylindrales bacterium]|nr:cytochrome P450 [Candidatus Limnocylindrales bacterium]
MAQVESALSVEVDESWKSDPWLGVFPPLIAKQDDPYALLARLREYDPINETPIGLWRLTRYEDVVRMLREVPSGVRFADGSIFGSAQSPNESLPGKFILQQDAPNHTRLRKLMSVAFRPRATERLRARTEEIVSEQIDGILERGSMDVISDLALPVPSTVICEMMGVPSADRAKFAEWTSAATHLLAALLSEPAVVKRGLAAAGELAAYFTELIGERRRSPREDILSDLVRAEEDGDRLTGEELLSQAIGLLIAGFETTIGLIGNGVHALLRNPDQLRLLEADPSLIAGTVEECLRYDGPIMLTVRITREDTPMGDKVIPANRAVVCLLAAANHDPAHFRDPDTFDICRADNDHLSFGGGAHFCLGAHLARMETQVAIGALVRRVRGLELAGDDRTWGSSLFRVLGKLPVGFAGAR